MKAFSQFYLPVSTSIHWPDVMPKTTVLLTEYQRRGNRIASLRGDLLAMSMYALAAVSLVCDLKLRIYLVWFANNATGTNTCASLKMWWNSLSLMGPNYGYCPRLLCWLSHLLNEWQGNSLLGGCFGFTFRNKSLALRFVTWLSLLSEVCLNVAVKPGLQPLSGEFFTHRTANFDDDAHPSVKARGFWMAH